MGEQQVLHYREQGQGRPVILMHGLFGSLDNLALVARKLAAQYRVISVDLRNHGRSFHRPDMGYTHMADDVCRLLDALKIKQAVMLGHSMGGKCAMQMALDHSERVQGLIVGDIAPVTYPVRHDNVLNAISSYCPDQMVSRTLVDQQLATFIEMPAVRQLLMKSMVINDRGEYIWRLNAQALVANYDGIRAMPDNGEKVYSGPTLFIKGEQSDYLLPEHQLQIQTHFPKAAVRVIKGAGHWLHAEKPELFSGIVIRFLEQLGDQ